MLGDVGQPGAFRRQSKKGFGSQTRASVGRESESRCALFKRLEIEMR